ELEAAHALVDVREGPGAFEVLAERFEPRAVRVPRLAPEHVLLRKRLLARGPGQVAEGLEPAHVRAERAERRQIAHARLLAEQLLPRPLLLRPSHLRVEGAVGALRLDVRDHVADAAQRLARPVHAPRRALPIVVLRRELARPVVEGIELRDRQIAECPLGLFVLAACAVLVGVPAHVVVAAPHLVVEGLARHGPAAGVLLVLTERVVAALVLPDLPVLPRDLSHALLARSAAREARRALAVLPLGVARATEARELVVLALSLRVEGASGPRGRERLRLLARELL